MKTALIAMTAGLWCCTGAAAQTPDCKTIPDAAARLACFDKATTAKKLAPDQFAAVKADVSSKFRDPGSATFAGMVRAMRPNVKGEPTDSVCGTVNAKNAFGGYTGAKRFVYFYATKTSYVENEGSVPEAATIVINNFCK